FRRTPRSPLFPYTTLFRSKAQAVAEIFNCLSVLAAAGGDHEFAQRHLLGGLGLRRAIELRNSFRRDCEVDALAAGDLQRCYANNLAVHVDDWAATRSRRDWRRDLDDAAKTGNVAHRRNNSVRHAAFQAEGIA